MMRREEGERGEGGGGRGEGEERQMQGEKEGGREAHRVKSVHRCTVHYAHTCAHTHSISQPTCSHASVSQNKVP